MLAMMSQFNKLSKPFPKEGRVDVLINNAGISGGFAKVADITVEDVEKVYNTNVFGIVRMMNTFIPLLEQSQQPVVVNVSSGLGSFGMVTNPDKAESKVNSLAYCSSKSAVTMLTLQYSKGLPHMQINAQTQVQLTPIWLETSATTLNQHQKASNQLLNSPQSMLMVQLARLSTVTAQCLGNFVRVCFYFNGKNVVH